MTINRLWTQDNYMAAYNALPPTFKRKINTKDLVSKGVRYKCTKRMDVPYRPHVTARASTVIVFMHFMTIRKA